MKSRNRLLPLFLASVFVIFILAIPVGALTLDDGFVSGDSAENVDSSSEPDVGDSEAVLDDSEDTPIDDVEPVIGDSEDEVTVGDSEMPLGESLVIGQSEPVLGESLVPGDSSDLTMLYDELVLMNHRIYAITLFASVAFVALVIYFLWWLFAKVFFGGI